mgnify:CR=1 FL=1
MQLFERPRKGERALLVFYAPSGALDDEAAQEFQELARSAGADVVSMVVAKRQRPDPAYLVGSGKLKEIAEAVVAHEAEVVIVSHTLAPGQERNLERELKCRVIDRTGLILDIFAQRARSFEGQLQVELAQLKHLSTRLVRGWTHLERQKGGIGLRGPGETQLETDRRLIGERIKQLNKRLVKVERQRHEQRKSRVRSSQPTVSIVGYTNAGKSTLFNRLTGSAVYAADQLFATLDPTLRRIDLPDAPPVVLADTVGFVRDLPHTLVAAFRATLEETVEADLLLHVVDAHDDEHAARITDVDAVLHEIGADTIAQIIVFNKIDLLPGAVPRIDRNSEGRVERVWLSAVSGDGLNLLLAALSEWSVARAQRMAAAALDEREPPLPDWRDAQGRIRFWLAPGAGRLRAVLYQRELVRHEAVVEDGGWLMEISALPADLAAQLAQAGERGLVAAAPEPAVA